jgi:tRNA pseudouridine13 synthase
VERQEHGGAFLVPGDGTAAAGSREAGVDLALRARLCYRALVKLKQRPEDFVVREGYHLEDDPTGNVWVYRLDKQKLSTLQALERLGKEFGVRRRALSVAGLKDKQGRTEQLLGVEGGALGETEVVQSGDLRLTFIGRSATPISSANITANRFEVTVRDLTRAEAERVPESVREVQRAGVVNYFDSQRFGFLKHGQGFIGRQLVRGDWEGALRSFLATPSELDKSDDAHVKRFWAEHWGQWQLHAPHDAAKKYAPMLRRLREDPTDFQGAFLHIERRTRMMALFELQSYVWNEGVRRYLISLLPAAELIGLRYQAGALLLPRSLPPELRERLHKETFPLLAHDSTFADKGIEAAARSALSAQGLRLEELKVPDTTQLFFKHEERPLFVLPDKLRVNEPRPDELNRGKVKVNLSFTLPPGAYATLVVRRVLWFCTEGAREGAAEVDAAARAARGAWGREPVRESRGMRGDGPPRDRPAAPPPAPAPKVELTPEQRHEQLRAQGFRARQKAKKVAKQEQGAKGAKYAKGAKGAKRGGGAKGAPKRPAGRPAPRGAAGPKRR